MKNVSISMLEARLGRSIRPKDRLWATIRLAEKLFDKESTQIERSLVLFSEAERLAEDIGDRRGTSAAIRGIGVCQLNLSNLPAALESFERALPIAEETGDAECEIKVLRNMGAVYSRQSRQELALTTLAKCGELAELVGNISLQASTMNEMGIVFVNLGRYSESLECHTKSLALLSGSGAIVTKARAIKKASGWMRDQAITLGYLSTALLYLGRYEEAFSALDQSSHLFHAMQDRRNEGVCQLNMGMIHLQIGDYSRALSSLYASIKTLDRVGDKRNLAAAYTNLMAVYRLLNNTELTIDFSKKALSVYQEIGDELGQIEVYEDLGEFYLDQAQPARAKQFLKRSLALSREAGLKRCERMALTALAKLDANSGRFDTAEKLYGEALDIAHISSDREGTIATLIGLANLFLKRGEPNETIGPLEQAIHIAREIHSRRHEQEAHSMLAEALEGAGKPESALHHFKLASSIEKEIMGVEKQRAIAELQVRSDIEILERENTLWKKEAKLKSQEIERITMVLAEKAEWIRSMKRDIRVAVRSGKEGGEDAALHAISKIDRVLLKFDKEESTEGKKSVFHNEFQLVHRDVLQKLSEHYPDLTFAQRKICVLVREQLSTKQIAAMLRVSTRTIDEHRYKIRKLMKIPQGVDLTTILTGIL